jgi:hypothetical protein
MVGNTAVDVDSSAVEVSVDPATEEVRTVTHACRITKRIGVHHVSDGAVREILTHHPADSWRVRSSAVKEIDHLAEDVRKGLVECARLHVVEEVGGLLRHRAYPSP